MNGKATTQTISEYSLSGSPKFYKGRKHGYSILSIFVCVSGRASESMGDTGEGKTGLEFKIRPRPSDCVSA